MPGYWSIDLDILITTATERLPAMADQLTSFHLVLDQPRGLPDDPDPDALV